MDLSLNTSVKQEQTLSPLMLQSLALLPMPVEELRAYIEHEIENNPALEIPQRENENANEEYEDFSSADDDSSDRKEEAIENSEIFSETLSSHLLKQLGLSDCDEETTQICQMLIGNLDANGFFIVDLNTLFEKTKFSGKAIKKALKLVQTFEPYGICCKDFRESLIIQAKCCNMAESDLKIFSTIVNDYLEMLKCGKIKEVSEALHISQEDLETFFSILKSFNPYPGRLFDNSDDSFVVPEFSIHNVDGKLVITMMTQNLPKLEISEEFTSLAKDLKGPDAQTTSQYITSSLNQAKNLINQVEMRNKTMLKAATALSEYQKDFFFNGPRFLKAITLKTVADAIGIHEATMSRLAQSKWIETDWGIFEMKYFFSQGVKDDSGESVSRNVVKDMIAEILKDNKKLSDQKISDMLKEKGISCARRTVGKYRSELNIDSSFYRR